MDKYVVVLAAGKGTSMNSRDPEHCKVSYPILGKPIIRYVLDAVLPMNPKKIVTVVGYGGEQTKKLVEGDSEVVWQNELLGTGHAVLQAKPLLQGLDGETLIIYGDTPLVSTFTIETILRYHEKNFNDLTVVSADLVSPSGYGRIIRDSKTNKVVAIREERDCSINELDITEVNTGICVIDNRLLFKYIDEISNDNVKGLYYLSELVEKFVGMGLKVGAYMSDDMKETFCINNRAQLAYAGKIIRKRTNNELMLSGVSIEDPHTTYISPDVRIGQDTVILPNTTILGHSIIGENCHVGPNTFLDNVVVGNDARVISSFLKNTKVEDGEVVEPFTVRQ